MAGPNIVIPADLDADFIQDLSKEKIRTIVATTGTAAPSAEPTVAEKIWFYVRTGVTPNQLWAWLPGSPGSWVQVADDDPGEGTVGWALDGNVVDTGEVLGSTNAEDLRIVCNGDIVGLLKAPDPLNPGDPVEGITFALPDTGPATAAGLRQHLFIGPSHPDLGTGPIWVQGDLDDTVSNPLQSVQFSPPAAGRGDVIVETEGGVSRATQAVRRFVTQEATFEAIAFENGEENAGARVTGSSRDGAEIEMRRVEDNVYAGAYFEATGGGANVRASLEVGDESSTVGAQQMQLDLGGLDLIGFVQDPLGETVGGAGNHTSILVGYYKAGTAEHGSGMYLASGRLALKVTPGADPAGSLELVLIGDDVGGTEIENLFTLPLTKNAVTGNYEITA
jgi:hypothetical protein